VNKKFKNTPITQVTTKSKILGVLFLMFFFLGTYFTILTMEIFEVTIINAFNVFCIWLATGLIVLPITYKLLKEDGKKSYLFWQLCFNCLTFGGIITFSILTLNNHFLNDTNSHYKLQIKKRVI
jgi:Kef-type K+ transport system membrane component KefB